MAGNLKLSVGSFSENQKALAAVESRNNVLKLVSPLPQNREGPFPQNQEGPFPQNREALVAMQSSQRKVFGFDGDSRTFDRQRQNFYTACFVQWHCPLRLHCISQIPWDPSNAKC